MTAKCRKGMNTKRLPKALKAVGKVIVGSYFVIHEYLSAVTWMLSLELTGMKFRAVYYIK